MRIGVTGIFASGKGTVCSMFRELGGIVVDTDIIAREIVEPGHPCLERIIGAFGSQFINERGGLKRREFARHVFSDDERVELLNSITHPEILNITLERTAGNKIYFVDTPLLFEAGFNKKMEKNIVVRADRSQAVERGIKRDNISGEEIESRLNYQIPLNEKIKYADYVIDNSGSLEDTKRQVIELWNTLNRLRTM